MNIHATYNTTIRLTNFPKFLHLAEQERLLILVKNKKDETAKKNGTQRLTPKDNTLLKEERFKSGGICKATIPILEMNFPKSIKLYSFNILLTYYALERLFLKQYYRYI